MIFLDYLPSTKSNLGNLKKNQLVWQMFMGQWKARTSWPDLARVEVIQKEMEKKKEEAESRKKIKRKAQRAFLQV